MNCIQDQCPVINRLPPLLSDVTGQQPAIGEGLELVKEKVLFATSLSILNASDIYLAVMELSFLIESEFRTNSSKGGSCVMNVHVHALIINHLLDIIL